MGIRHLPAIDGLRAVAVLSVLAYHAGLGGAGYVGVDVFFVISGYLITRLLKEDGDLVAFYARRARRILPAAVLVVVCTLALSVLLLPDSGDVARSASAAAIFGANFWFQHATSDYWASSAEQMPLLHLWSLSVEEQFYLLWPFLLLLRRRWMVVVFLASLALYAYLWWANPSAAFYQMPARAWELAAGGLVALWGRLPDSDLSFAGEADHVRGATPAGERDNGVRGQQQHGLVSLRPSSAAERVPQRGDGSEVDAARLRPFLRKCVSACRRAVNQYRHRALGVYAIKGLRDEGRIHEVAAATNENLHRQPRAHINVPAILRNLRTFVLQHGSHIGLAVIGLALLPWPVHVAQPLAVLGATLVVASVHAGHRSLLSARPLVWVGLISYSLYLWHWPLLAIDRAGRVGESPIGTRLALVAAAFVLAALSYRYVEQPFRRMRVRPARAVAIGVVCAAALATTAFSLARAPAPKPVVASSALSCSATLKPARCVGKEPKVVLWGDSYAGAWEGVVQRMGKVAVGMVDTGCPPVIGIDVPRPTPRASRYCKERAARDLAWLQANGADTLLVTAHWARLLRERPDAGSGVIAWAKALPNVRRIIVIGATPEIRDSIGKCHGEECDIPRGEYEASAAATKAVMRELGKLPNVEVWEVGDWMCGETCPAFRGGVALYQHDNHHISGEAAGAFVRYRRTAQQAR